MNNQKIKINPVVVIRMNVIGVATHYTVLVPTGKEGKAGFKRKKARYSSPKIRIDFEAMVDTALQVGSTYTDGQNTFLAIGKCRIIIQEPVVDTFNIPDELVLIYTPFCEGSSAPICTDTEKRLPVQEKTTKP